MMYEKINKIFFTTVIIACFALVGCAPKIPLNILKLPEDSLHKKELQTRQYETTNEEEIITACAGVLQDLGFTLDESETKLGLIAASKNRDATDTGQIVTAVVLTCLAALAGSSSDAMQRCDDVQKIKASVVTRLSSDESRMLVRVTFQRLIWNKAGVLSRIETLDDSELYQGFFERLSKAIFLEAHKI